MWRNRHGLPKMFLTPFRKIFVDEENDPDRLAI
jgi:hypothetical protein